MLEELFPLNDGLKIFIEIGRVLKMDCYERISVIGKGPLGLTYKMKNKKTNELVACRVVDRVDEPSGQVRTILEEAIVFTLSAHPHIAGCLCLYHDRAKDMFYFVHEFFPRTLHDLLIRHQHSGAHFSEDTIWEVLAQILLAVTYLHSADGKSVKNCNYEPLVVHRLIHSNLKPSNVMITQEGRIKLVDNRIRQPIRAYLEKCGDMSLHYYTAPELYDSEDKWTEAIDVWSIGCIAYHMASLKPPFQAAMLDQILAQQRAGTYTSIPSHYSYDLRDFISSMLVVDCARRPSVVELSSHPRILHATNRLSSSLQTHLAALL